ncbi:hypothetical protein M0812_25044 [Anaeramoeba flamelloides]|uniref:Uncharacterized protein n=1 Tax=Anaeramoeba flamelloides TaxID=1746091 RepID=A0AAV7YM40_9EUKA|nr:hypothetical protein M0812_25044 [Anaeramoeba flamelloides]
MNQKRDLTRRKTVNQERIYKLFEIGTHVIKGMTSAQLLLQNAPKEMRIHCDVLHKMMETRASGDLRIEAKDLILVFLYKYNLFPSNFATLNHDQYLVFTPIKQTAIGSLAEYIATANFQKKVPKIIAVVEEYFEKFPKMFKGMQKEFLKPNYCLPKQVTIEKSALRMLCKQESNRNVKNEMKKLYRGLTFFFKARFNLINGTRKNRLRMIFVLTLQKGSVGQEAAKWEKVLEIFLKNRNLNISSTKNSTKPIISYKNLNTAQNTNTNTITFKNTNTNIFNTLQVSQSLQKLKSPQRPQRLPNNTNRKRIPNYLFKTINNNHDTNYHEKLQIVSRSPAITNTNNTNPMTFLKNPKKHSSLQLNNDCFSLKLRKIDKLKINSHILSEEDLKFEIVNLLVHLKNIPNHQK